MTGVATYFITKKLPKTEATIIKYYERKTSQLRIMPGYLRNCVKFEDDILAQAIDMVESSNKVPMPSSKGIFFCHGTKVDGLTVLLAFQQLVQTLRCRHAAIQKLMQKEMDDPTKKKWHDEIRGGQWVCNPFISCIEPTNFPSTRTLFFWLKI